VDAEGWTAYRNELFSLVGDDDPAEVQAATPALVRDRVAAAGVDLRERPLPEEWSVLELVGHLADAEIFAAARYRWVLAHDHPDLMPFDQDLLATRLRHNGSEPDAVLAMFEGLRRGNLELWSRTSPREREREGIHAERGPSSYQVLFREIAGHDRFHLAQIDRTLESLTPAAG
jgi:hypothetical protein